MRQPNSRVGMRSIGRARRLALLAALLMLAVACGDDSPPTGEAAPPGDEPGASGAGSIVDEANAALEVLYAGTDQPPPSEGPAGVADKNVWVISCGQAALACATMSEAAAEAAETIGWETNLFDGNFNAENAYSTGIRQAVAGGADGIILVSIDCGLVRQPLVEAQDAGVEVVIMNALGCEGDDLATLVVPSEESPTLDDWAREWGMAKASWVIAQTDGQANVLLFVLEDSLQTVAHDEGFNEQMSKCSGCTVEVVNTTLADLGPPLAEKVDSALLSNRDANAIVVPYDSMISLGAGPAIVRSGRDLEVMGGEGYEPNITLIREGGGQSAAMASDGRWTGWHAVDTLNRVFAGEEPAPQGIGFTAIDRDHNLPPEGQGFETAIDYRSIYLAIWGVEG